MPTRFIKYQIRSVRSGLFLLIALLAVPSLAIISILSWEAYRNQQAAVRSELQNTARAVAGVVDTEIERSLVTLHALAATESLRRHEWAALDAIARRLLPNSHRWFVLVDMTGRQLVNTRVPTGAPIPNIALDPEYVAAMRAGREFVSNLVYGPAAGHLVTHIALSYTDSSGELYGLSIVEDPDAVARSLELSRLSSDSVLSVVDRNGKIIARSMNAQEYVGRSATQDMVQATRERAEGVAESVTLEHIPVLTAFVRTKSGWTVLIGAPKERVLAGTRRLFAISFGSALGVTLAAILLALWIARVVVDAVERLADDARHLAQGQPAAASASRLQEIHLVADAMRDMAATKSDAEAQLREARDRLQHYAAELEQKVKDRTASLQDAVSQMEEFSYTVSHDLRGPLRAMSGFATALLEEYSAALDNQGREYLSRIVRASDRMNRLTSDLLNYSRIAREDLIPTRVALESVLRGIVDHYGELHPGAADVTLVTPMDDVLAHESALTQALANLMTNAAKFVKPGARPQITVRTERRGNRVRVWVEDNGIGIDPRHHNRLFRIFERAPAALFGHRSRTRDCPQDSGEVRRHLWRRIRWAERQPVLAGIGRSLATSLFACHSEARRRIQHDASMRSRCWISRQASK